MREPGLWRTPEGPPRLPHLRYTQVLGLSLWRVGIVLMQRCGVTQVAVVLAYLLERREASVREQVPDTYREAAANTARRTCPPRALSCFQRGRLLLVTALCTGRVLPTMQLHPEPWPKSLDTHVLRPEAYRPFPKAA